MAPLKYKLSYFDMKGVGEPIRFLLSYGKVDFEDHRVNNDRLVEWPKLKPTTPFGQLPILEFDGKKICQSTAICRYLGKQFEINGKDDWEALQIDILVDTFSDFRQTMISYHFFPGTPAVKEEQKKVVFSGTMPYYLPKFEETVKNNGGFFVGGKLSWADIYWTAQAGYVMTMLKGVDMTKDYPHLKALEQKVLAIPSIKAWVAKRPITD